MMNGPTPQIIPFAMRPPSSAWENVPLPMVSGLAIPVWFRPPQAPNGITISVSRALLSQIADRRMLTLQHLITACGLHPAEVGAVSIFGSNWIPAPVLAQVLPQPLPDLPAGDAGQIMIVSHTPAAMPPMPTAAPAMQPTFLTGTPQSDDDAMDFDAFSGGINTADLPADPKLLKDRIESDWQSCLQLERQVGTLRQKLSGALSKLGSLDRDLAPQERLAAQRDDVDAWQDARRWIRDASAKVHRFVKAHDVGITSAAGRRNHMEQLYQQCMSSILAPAQIGELYREMETYRKLLSHLQANMTNALSSANQDAEGRARRVLQRINAKMQTQRRQWRSGK